MDDQPPTGPAQSPADSQPRKAGIVRELFDLNTIYDSDAPGWFRRWVMRGALFGLGSWIGGILWQLVTDSSGDRPFWERILTNVYLWTTLIATGLYALHDRRTGRRSSTAD